MSESYVCLDRILKCSRIRVPNEWEEIQGPVDTNEGNEEEEGRDLTLSYDKCPLTL